MAELSDYDVRVCVFGSRSYNNYDEFSGWLRDYVSWLASDSLCFVSGAARNGPDAMIIRWAKENNYDCFEFEADWDTHGKSAGFIRNREMRGVINRGLGFWDGVSSGTAEMIEGCMDAKIELSTIIVKPDADRGKFTFVRNKYHGNATKEKSKGGGGFDPFRFRGNSSWKRKR